MTTSPPVRKLLGLLYLAGLLIMADQFADLLATLLATNPAFGAANWRFGAFGLLISRISVFLVADVMIFAAAAGLEHRKLLRTLGIVHLVLAIMLLAGLALFALDWLQVRRAVQPAGARPFDLAALRAAGLLVLAIVVFAWGGIVAFGAVRTRTKGGRREEVSPLLTDMRGGDDSST